MLGLSVGLYAALRAVGGVFEQARTGAVEALLVQSAAIGVVVMASIQTVRAIIPVRSIFHRHRVAVWLGRAPDVERTPADFRQRMLSRIESDPWLWDYVQPDTTEAEILRQLLRLTTAEGGDRPAVSLAFFDLPLEQLCGQISAGSERAIIHPKQNGALLLRLANAAGEDDVLGFFRAHLDSTSDEGAFPRDEVDERLMRARAGVEERVRRSIDCLQIENGFYWRRRLRVLAVALSAAVGLTAALVGRQFASSVMTALTSGVLGGFFAMVARDLTAIVERLRRVP